MFVTASSNLASRVSVGLARYRILEFWVWDLECFWDFGFLGLAFLRWIFCLDMCLFGWVAVSVLGLFMRCLGFEVWFEFLWFLAFCLPAVWVC